MSQEEFVSKVSILNPQFEILSDYQGNISPVMRRCKICGDERYVSARSILEWRGCVVCAAKKRAQNRRKSNGQFISEMNAINPDIIILSEYVTGVTNVKCQCKIDGFQWETKPRILLGGSGCPECGRKNNAIASRPRMTHDEFVHVVTERFRDVKVLSEFHSTAQRVHYQCQSCGYEWDARPSTILSPDSKGCPRCAGKTLIDIDTFLERLNECNPYVEYVCGYTKISSSADFRCKKCGHQWSALPHNILKGRGCPKCKMSHGAKFISAYLNARGIPYEAEYKFTECADERPLPFDFYLAQKRIAIEYDGEQHFEPVVFGGYSQEDAVRNFELTQKHDRMKDKFCSDNNIKLIRIPYTEFDKIETILDKQIS